MSFHINSEIKKGSILGINYSGMHDSAIAVISPEGETTLAFSFERISRVKGDGRWLYDLIEKIDQERLSAVAISTNESMPENCAQKITGLQTIKRNDSRIEEHSEGFYKVIEKIKAPKFFVDHQRAHAASAFWGSGYDKALCITYDGGMYNSPWFLGCFSCSRKEGVREVVLGSATQYPKVTSLYTFVTAMLGFKPNRHEGKITGLSALGEPSASCMAVLKDWWLNRYSEIESCFEWKNTYAIDKTPQFVKNIPKLKAFRDALSEYSNETIAASIQKICEDHVLSLVEGLLSEVGPQENICLAGGLFANVKLNQVIADQTKSNIFVFPAMGDEGTAIGSAMQVYFDRKKIAPLPIKNMFLGIPHENNFREILEGLNIKVQKNSSDQEVMAKLLSKGKVIALFRGRSEFGPRALGHRSIISQASNPDINDTLNKKLNRTEFMPFAPIIRSEDLEEGFKGFKNKIDCFPYMTCTVECSEKLESLCPAIVHVDKTARPQVVYNDTDPFLHELITNYKQITGLPCLINTSFNIHEEPIVESLSDALRGFFISGLDYLYIEGEGLVAFVGNENAAIKLLSESFFSRKHKEKETQELIVSLQEDNLLLKKIALEKEEFIQGLSKSSAKNGDAALELTLMLREKEKIINKQAEKIHSFEDINNSWLVRGASVFFRKKKEIKKKIISIFSPRLGRLNQFPPAKYDKSEILKNPQPFFSNLKVSIITPSLNQGEFIEETLKSVIDQSYNNIEHIVQDGGSTDETINILKEYEGKITHIHSEADSGQSDAINKGFLKSSGDILCWLNSDDVFFKHTIAHAVKIFEDNPDIDVLYGDRIIIDKEGHKIGRWLLPGHCSNVLQWADFIPQETLFWRREIWDKVGGKIDDSFKFAMDWDLLIRFKKAGAKFHHTPNFLGAFRYHEDSKTSSQIEEMGVKEMNRIRKEILGYLPSNLEIRKEIAPFLIRNIIRDLWFRIRLYQPFNCFKPKGVHL